MMRNELHYYVGSYEFPYPLTTSNSLIPSQLHLLQYSIYPFRHHQITLSYMFSDQLSLKKYKNAHRSQNAFPPCATHTYYNLSICLIQTLSFLSLSYTFLICQQDYIKSVFFKSQNLPFSENCPQQSLYTWLCPMAHS